MQLEFPQQKNCILCAVMPWNTFARFMSMMNVRTFAIFIRPRLWAKYSLPWSRIGYWASGINFFWQFYVFIKLIVRVKKSIETCSKPLNDFPKSQLDFIWWWILFYMESTKVGYCFTESWQVFTNLTNLCSFGT